MKNSNESIEKATELIITYMSKGRDVIREVMNDLGFERTDFTTFEELINLAIDHFLALDDDENETPESTAIRSNIIEFLKAN